MTKLSKRTCLNKVLVALFLTILVAVCSIGFWFGQRDFLKSVSVSASLGDSSVVTVHYIDVGQGDSIFIDTSNRDVLIDGGSAGSPVLDYLNALSITRVHLMVATHVHEDHIGGLVSVLSSTMSVDEILINNQTYASETYTDFMDLAEGHVITVARRGQTFLLTETVNLTVFNPVQPLEFSGANDNSVVVKLQVGSVSFLFMGDAEAEAEQSMLDAGLDLKCDVLKVGHHGSRTATTQSFLDGVAPLYAVISAGEDNVYGHPHQETIDKLLAMGVTTYGTFLSGTIVASTNGTSIVFQGNPQPIPEFQSGIILPVFMIATLIVVIVYERKHSSVSNIGKN